MMAALRVAEHWEPAPSGAARCVLCPHRCLVKPGASGRCRARENRDGVLYAATWGIASSLALDPVEKKPFARWHPGSRILSVGGFGCNLSCRFCQNHRISQVGPEEGEGFTFLPPEALVDAARATKAEGNVGIAFTYNEPLVAWEYVRDTARAARNDSGLAIALVTNGYVNPEPLAELLPLVDAMNIDLKAFTEGFYRDVCGGSLAPVLETIRAGVASGAHVELTTLVIPGLNDDPDEIARLASWVASASPDIVLHLNRHHPDYLMREIEPIARDRLLELRDIAARSVADVRCGNLG